MWLAAPPDWSQRGGCSVANISRDLRDLRSLRDIQASISARARTGRRIFGIFETFAAFTARWDCSNLLRLTQLTGSLVDPRPPDAAFARRNVRIFEPPS